MFRKDVVLAAGGYRDQYRHAEDYDLWLRILKRGRGYNLPEVLLHRRMTPGMLTVRNKKEMIGTVLKTKFHYAGEFGAGDYWCFFRDLVRYLKAMAHR